MKKYTLNKEELEILEAFENGEIKKSEEDFSQYVQMAKNVVVKFNRSETDSPKIK